MPTMESHDAMDAELASLEQRIGQLAQLVRRLREENSALRDANAAAVAESSALRVKVDAATQRLQRLLERLPEEGVQ